MKEDIKKLIQIAQQAGQAIMAVYNDPKSAYIYDKKADNSPLTLADKASHHVIVKALEPLSDSPIISEEGEQVPYEVRKNWERFWLIDPLDGTKEFIHRNGEFTVNIALIEKNEPVLGIIYVPVQEVTYYGMKGMGAFKQIANQPPKSIQISEKADRWIAVRSKSHPSPEEEHVFKHYPVSDFMAVGSSLKFCMVAEGKAELYYRHGPTMEWDTAAGQAIVCAAGGAVFQNQDTATPFRYNKESLLNGSFLCLPNKK